MITAARRHSLPKSEFGLPAEEKYPVDTKKRARAALSYASKEENAGKLSAADADRVRAKARRKLGRAEQGASHLEREAKHRKK